jgi:hypothetical protein
LVIPQWGLTMATILFASLFLLLVFVHIGMKARPNALALALAISPFLLILPLTLVEIQVVADALKRPVAAAEVFSGNAGCSLKAGTATLAAERAVHWRFL